MGRQLLVQWTTEYFSLYQDCHHVPAAFCLQHRDERISLLGTSSVPVQSRSDKHACGKPMLTDHDKQATGNREPANEMNKEDPTQGIPVWLQPFTVNLEDLEAPVLAHSFERENSEWCFKSGDTKKRRHSVHAYFRRNQRRSNLRSEKDGDLTTAEHKVLNEGRESQNNHRYAVVVQVLATQWNPCQTNFKGDGEEFTKVPIAVTEAKS